MDAHHTSIRGLRINFVKGKRGGVKRVFILPLVRAQGENKNQKVMFVYERPGVQSIPSSLQRMHTTRSVPPSSSPWDWLDWNSPIHPLQVDKSVDLHLY